jgi:hypothetical protein
MVLAMAGTWCQCLSQGLVSRKLGPSVAVWRWQDLKEVWAGGR